MTQKLAIAISGAVSLGSFESGVMYEIIEAIAQHNEHPDTTEEQKIIIDVITGASAGAMTGAIVTQKLLFEADHLRHPNQNHIYQAWVEDADIETLLESRGGDDPDQAILSSNFVQQVGSKYLLNRYQSSTPSIQRHPAAGDSIHLGMALSNLNGYDFKIGLTSIVGELDSPNDDNCFTYTKHQDRYITEIQGNQDDQRDLWEAIKRIAIASGSFPFVFQVQEIIRSSSDRVYQGSEFYTEPGTPPQKRAFAYSDGGIFENEPLGMAISITKGIDRVSDYDKRFFLYVAPGAKTSMINKEFTAARATYVNTAKVLTGAIFTQARFQDWIQVSQFNQLVKDFDRQAEFLKELLLQNPEKQPKFEEVAENLLQTLYKDNQEQEQADYERLRQQFDQEYQELKNIGDNDDQIAASWLKSVQALEKASNLSSKELLTVYAITAKDEELASEQLSAFAGFFDQRFREYDYFVGRDKAVHFLKQLQQSNRNGQQLGQLYLLNFEPGKDLQKPEVNLGDVGIDQVDRKLRQRTKKLLLDRLGRIIDSIDKPWWLGWPLKTSIKMAVGDRLNQVLKL